MFDKRLIFRPTEKQYNRIKTVYMKSGEYKTMSELLRRIFEIGLKELEE